MPSGDLTEILVKEGDRVQKGQLLARIEDVQPEADVNAQKATLSSAEAEFRRRRGRPESRRR